MVNALRTATALLFICVLTTAFFLARARAAQSGSPATPATGSPNAGHVGTIVAGQSAPAKQSQSMGRAAQATKGQAQSRSQYPPIEKIDQPGLRYRLLDYFGQVHYCDSYSYPVGRSDLHDALTAFPEIRNDQATFAAITEHVGWKGRTDFTDADKAAIYRQYRKLRWAVRLEPAGSQYSFQLAYFDNLHQGFRVTGVITPPDKIKVLSKEPALLKCPICLARGTRIDTPGGPVAVEDLRAGMLVWTLDGKNARVAAPVQKVSAVPVPAGHRVVHLVMQDGRELWVSAGHPTADGRSVGQLQQGNIYNHSTILKTETVSYAGDETYDLLPAGDTGFYWANGILLGSTLK